MSTKVLFITPPFTQLNTAYPATAYLTGFLQEKEVSVNQCDLSIELFNNLFTKDFITKIFNEAENNNSLEFNLVWQQKESYIDKVETIISFLQNHEVTKAYKILSYGFIPKSHRFEKLEDDLDWAFGNLGILDKAKHFATLFIEELGDFDSLEIVRQLFENDCIQSAFWHQFTTTIHSPIGKNPSDFDIEITGPKFEGFAQNDLYHVDPKGAEHHMYKEGLNLALYNYLNGIGFELPMQDWFNFKVPKTTHNPNYIVKQLL